MAEAGRVFAKPFLFLLGTQPDCSLPGGEYEQGWSPSQGTGGEMTSPKHIPPTTATSPLRQRSGARGYGGRPQ